MNTPLVSVCLPNLNNRVYLDERVETILAQTYTNWELVVSDNYSDDGAWEFFEKLAAKDSRVLIEQAPRQGLYPNWNNCIQRARGEYVYIATSDDTMALDCLEKMVAALEDNPDCDLAHCPLVVIDQNGAPHDVPKWPDCTAFAWGAPDLVRQSHVRRAPYDGLLHLTGQSVYLSITELLIRRSLFSRIGGFESRWGSIGDLNWDMKAGLVANTIHVPDTWASFRVHPAQSTAAVKFASAEHFQKIQEMIEDAVAACEPYLAPAVLRGLREDWIEESHAMRDYYRELLVRGVGSRRMYQVGQVLGSGRVRTELINVQRGAAKWTDRAPLEIRQWMESLGLGPAVTTVVESVR
jgi:hypothetical protein